MTFGKKVGQETFPNQTANMVNDTNPFSSCRLRGQFRHSGWGFLSPKTHTRRKVFCVILVVCPPLILPCVKDIRFKDTGRPEVDWARWQREAIDESIAQIIGAERWLENVDRVTRSDGTEGLPLPPKGERRYHRIAVAFGGNRRVPLDIIRESSSSGSLTHVLDERSFRILLENLNTITDLTKYLADKEWFLKRKEKAEGGRVALWLQGGEEDLLALYLGNDRIFPEKSLLILTDGLWDEFSRSPGFTAKLRKTRTATRGIVSLNTWR